MSFPTISSCELGIEILSTLLHGGHSFVFKARTTKGIGALKIFRFTIEDPRNAPIESLSPYLYFNREVEAYARLIQGNAGYCSRLLSIVSISAEDEKALKSHMQGYNAGLHRRKFKRSQEELPLKALLIEWIDGDRLASQVLLTDIALQGELIQAVEHMHGYGIVWGDATWRNILIRESPTPKHTDTNQTRSESGEDGCSATLRGTNRLVLLDYSNARCRPPMVYENQRQEGFETVVNTEDWSNMSEHEYGLVKHMIAFGKVRSQGAPRYSAA